MTESRSYSANVTQDEEWRVVLSDLRELASELLGFGDTKRKVGLGRSSTASFSY
jgi:hypothetical protein